MPPAHPPGPTIGLFSSQVPREMLYALGFTPMRVFPTAAKPTAAEAVLPRNFCALNRLLLASFLENDGAGLDGVIFADEDDATRRLHDVWRACVRVPVWGFLETPRAATLLAVRRYAEALTGMAAEVEAHTGRALSAANLRRAIAVYNEQRSLLAGLKQVWLTGDVETTAYRRLRRMALTQNPIIANERLRETLPAAPHSAAGRGPVGSRTGACRLLLLAELAAPADLVRLVETRGARVAAEDSDLDERELEEPVPAEAETVDGLLAALAHAYLSKPPGPRMRDLPRRLAYLSGLVAERGVQAAIFAYNKFCDLYLAEYPILREHLEGLGVPVLLLELEDDALSRQHRTRVEAFLEMLA